MSEELDNFEMKQFTKLTQERDALLEQAERVVKELQNIKDQYGEINIYRISSVLQSWQEFKEVRK